MKLWLVRRGSKRYSTDDINAIVEADTADIAVERLQQHMDDCGISDFYEAVEPEEIEQREGLVLIV